MGTYTASDFFASYPKFGGTPVSFSGTTVFGTEQDFGAGMFGAGTFGGSVINGVSNTLQTLAAGQLVVGPGVPGGATIVSVTPAAGNTLQIALSCSTSLTGTFTFAAYTAPLVPLAILTAFLTYAASMFDASRWQTLWPLAMGLYVAHSATIWLKTDGGTYGSPDQAGGAGDPLVVTTSKSVGDLSTSGSLPEGGEAWGAWSLTAYGQLLAKNLRLMGAGGIQLGGGCCW